MSAEREFVIKQAAKELAAMIGPNEGWGMWQDWLRSFAYRLSKCDKGDA